MKVGKDKISNEDVLILIVKQIMKKMEILLWHIYLLSKVQGIICGVIDSRGWLTFILFVARGIISGVFQAAYVYTPEVSVASLILINISNSRLWLSHCVIKIHQAL